uniref:KRAB domain-containing protein n=1 Tax=Monodelphis domestica TaxID=13616 RepID=A0A5F8GYV2_MONDO
MNPHTESVTFKAVAVDFTQEEWGRLDSDKWDLYLTVLLENYRNLVFLGLPVSKPELIFHMDQREEPRILERQVSKGGSNYLSQRHEFKSNGVICYLCHSR